MSAESAQLSRLRETSPAKYELLMRRLKERAAAGTAVAAAEEASAPVASAAGSPLSFSQQRLWFLDQLNPGDTAYNMPYALRLDGELDLELTVRAFQALVRRHETLRTTFAAVEGQPVQVVAAEPSWEPEVVDLRGTADAEARVRELASAHASAVFDLEHGPLFKVALVRLTDRQTVALVNLHHIICDDWSIGQLTGQFAACYAALRAGGEDPLPPLRLQYREHALRQRQRMEREGAAALDYWRKRFAGELPTLAVPTDLPRPPVQTHAGRTLSFPLSSELTSRLRALGRETGTTAFMVLLAGYSLLLQRYSGQDDLVIGTSVAGRDVPQTEPLIGFLTNTLALRTDLSGEPTFRQLLFRTRVLCLEAFGHQEVPFERVVEVVQPARDLSRSPLFQTMFSLHNAPRGGLDLDGLRISPFDDGAGRRTAMFDLSLDAVDLGEQLRLDWEYSTDLFTEPTITRMAEHLERLLTAAVAEPDQVAARLPMLLTEERHQLLTRANQVSVQVAPDECVHRLFEAQVAAAPDEVAVVDGEDRVSYRELNRRADLVAARLRALGVGPEVRVGLCAPRSADTVAAVLGVLKAGGAYVALDPVNPVDRLNFVLADASARLLLTRREVLAAAPGLGAGVTVALLDEWLAEPWDESAQPAPATSAVTSSNLAFVVYTSGSTGRAKGAMITHAALVSAYRSWERVYQLGTLVKRHLQAANVAFDVFTGDLVRSLCSGGTMVLCEREVLLDPVRLYELLQRERIDFADLVPVVVRLLADHVSAQGRMLDNFKILAVGADIWFMRDYWNLHRLCPPGTRLVNSYGITESTVDSGLFETPMPERADEEPVPIGRPLPNTEFYVLDPQLQPVPTGVLGTLYIGGLALARGYAARPGLTADRFLPHPYSDRPGARIYNTGDLARMLPSGDVEILGRVDRQVKLRGFRIELEEVESVLGQHPEVRAAAVVVVVDAKGDRRLAGYVEAHPGTAPAPGVLQDHLRGQLPYYMVPSTITLLDRMPLNANGKHDRKALPAPAAEPETADSAPAPCLTDPVERRVAAIWTEVLGAREVGAEDDFFELGGHSLLVPRVLFALRREFGTTMPLATLFEATTLRELARRVTSDAASGSQEAAAEADGVPVPVLDPQIRVRPQDARPRPAVPGTVLLTGATGFLGAHLLHRLLRDTDARVHCLVRADGPEQGLKRLLTVLAEFGLPEPADPARITVEPGDLGLPLLGLTPERFDRLADEVDAIHHSGAWVSFTLPYKVVRAANVGGTEEVLRLAARGGGIPVHHVSTASVPEAAAGSTPPAGGAAAGGYNLSKWAAEQLAVAARERGIPVDVYRPDFIGGDSTSGIGNGKDLIWAIVKGSIQLGGHPVLDGFAVRMVPVDRVADALLRLSQREQGGSGSFDLANPRPIDLTTVFTWVQRYGFTLERWSYQEWLARLKESVQQSWDNALFPFLGLFAGPAGPAGPPAPQSPAAPDRTGEAYAAAGTGCAPVDEPLLRIYLAELVRSGYLPAPDSTPSPQETS